MRGAMAELEAASISRSTLNMLSTRLNWPVVLGATVLFAVAPIIRAAALMRNFHNDNGFRVAQAHDRVRKSSEKHSSAIRTRRRS